MLSLLGPEGMSTDASDHDNNTGTPVFRVKHAAWRHPDAASSLHSLDALHRDTRFRPIRRNTRGSHPHLRVMSSLISTSAPMAGLPEGLYNPNWLASLSPRMREDLNVVPSGPYDFGHTSLVDLYAVFLLNSKFSTHTTPLSSVVNTNNGRLDSVHGFT